MTDHTRRWLSAGLLASAGAGVLSLTSIMNAAFAYGDTAVDAAVSASQSTVPAITQVMGGSGLPIPSLVPGYIPAVNDLFIQPNLPGTTPQQLFTPEGLYPLTGVKTLPLDTSVFQGLTILNETIVPGLQAGTPEGVFGYSQSATISSLEMLQLQQEGLSGAPASFVLIGDPSAPNGGLLTRFADLYIPSLGINFYPNGATPSDAFDTTIYTIQYDGFADFPRYPINLLADVNAFAGIYYLHGTYPDLTSAQLATAFLLPGSQGLGADTLTNYWLIPETNLPLLDPLRSIPFVGNPLANLIQPDLTVLVNLGYGPDNLGYSTPANVPTTFGLFPNVNPLTVLQELAGGAQQGVANFMGDMHGGAASLGASAASLMDPSSAASGLSALMAGASPAAMLAALSPSSLIDGFTNAVNTISSAASTAYATLLPTADIANALLTTLPAYDVSLFVDNLSNPLDAIGLPVAADFGLGTMAAGFEFEVLASAAATIVGDFTSLIP